MDDLSGLEWSASDSSKGAKSTTMNTNQTSFYPSLRPTPSPQVSGRNTPLSSQGSGLNASKTAASKPATDSFSNLVSFSGTKSNANLSLRERAEQLEAEKRRKEDQRRQQLQSQYGGGQFLDNLGQGSTNASRTASPAFPTISSGNGVGAQNGNTKNDDDDLFAAFNKDTKVDNSSHYPPPLQPTSGKSTPANANQLDLTKASAWSQPPVSGGGDFDDFDDPFGLNQIKTKVPQQPTLTTNDDDDFLGDLAKPVEEVRRKIQASQPKPEPGKPIDSSDSDSDSEPEVPQRRRGDDPFDKAVAELVEMGFTPENARRGLTESGAGLNIQATVGWLLDDAHKTSRQKQTPRDSPAERTRPREDAGRSRNNASPAWMTEDQPERRDNRSTAASSGDLSQKAAAVGSSFFKTANSLWKTGQKQVQKAVAEFNQEGGDPNQPKWMRSALQDRALTPEEKKSASVTDEALLLEAGSRPEKPSRSTREPQPSSSRFGAARDQSPSLPTRLSGQSSAVPKWQQGSQTSLDPRARLSKQAIEEQSAQAYVSPARRKKATPQPQVPVEPETDLLFNSTAAPPSRPQSQPQRPARSQPTASNPPSQAASRTVTPRPPAPSRQIPTVSPAAIQASTRHRLDGTAHFKRGDFDAAHTSYSNSLTGIPQMHPLCIVLLTNRALTALKTGSPKQAVDDADSAIKIIGPSRGEGEKVALGDGEQRDMKDLYGKALSRKAEALEQMEKWTDAGNVWQLCVEAGVGGATAAAGRQRCQKALAPKAKPTPKPVQAAKPRPRPSAVSDLGPQKSSEAVERLRAANKAAEKADDEKFALGEKVDARISAWRDGKRDNLRALLGSLDQVLWEGSGWKKIGLHELVMANRVKIHYMKAIAKTHPDKLPQDANTEVKLIAGTVFATLNESWDKFKSENGL